MKNEGLLLIDHSASPGLTPEDFRKVGITEQGLHRLGLSMAEFGEGKKLERATMRCCHCGKQVFLNAERIKPRSFCRTCPKGHDYICDDPKCHFDCRPFRKMIDDLQNDLAKAERIERESGAPKTVVIDLPDEPKLIEGT
jgi:hypothetical protein